MAQTIIVLALTRPLGGTEARLGSIGGSNKTWKLEPLGDGDSDYLIARTKGTRERTWAWMVNSCL